MKKCIKINWNVKSNCRVGGFMEELLVHLEGPVLLWIQENLRNDVLTPIMTFITHLGDAGFVWIALTIACLVYVGTRRTGILMTFSLLLNTLANNLLLKNLLARTRPYEIVPGLQRIIEAQGDFSFPSGHTGCSFAAAVVICVMCPRRYGIAAMVLAVMIALSRLYVGVHFPTDVIGGALIGTAAALFVCWIYKKKYSEVEKHMEGRN